MKKLIITLFSLLVMAVPTFASTGSFEYGQNDEGYYCYNIECNTVYNADASAISSHGNVASTQWWARFSTMTQLYWDRIAEMKVLTK